QQHEDDEGDVRQPSRHLSRPPAQPRQWRGGLFPPPALGERRHQRPTRRPQPAPTLAPCHLSPRPGGAQLVSLLSLSSRFRFRHALNSAPSNSATSPKNEPVRAPTKVACPCGAACNHSQKVESMGILLLAPPAFCERRCRPSALVGQNELIA